VEEAVPPQGSKHEVKTTILIVEDHFVTRWSAAEYLRMRGYKVIEAVDVTEALGIAAAGTPIDAVFSDARMSTSGATRADTNSRNGLLRTGLPFPYC
jgi:CheY-like chemotaxis protein